jgi:hypothetical protein
VSAKTWLRSCKCGYSATVYKVLRQNEKTGADEIKYHITCAGDCDYAGEYNTKKEAIAAWNSRAGET